MNPEEALEELEKISKDTNNWSRRVREAAKIGADAIREKQALDKLLRCWGSVEIKNTKGEWDE